MNKQEKLNGVINFFEIKYELIELIKMHTTTQMTRETVIIISKNRTK